MENIFYTQERIGKGGKVFQCYKIQTMYAGVGCPDEQIRTGVKYENDPRIIPTRKWMRKTGFDEIPQLINILLGDMALFGGRPIPHAEYDNLSANMQKRYIEQKPGLIGAYLFLDSGFTPHRMNDAYRRLIARRSYTKIQKLAIYTKVIGSTIKGLLEGKNY